MQINKVRRSAVLVLTCLLASCGQVSTENEAQKNDLSAQSGTPASKMPDISALLTPCNKHITKVSKKDLKDLTLAPQDPLKIDGWVEYSFSNGEKLLYINLRGMAVYGDVAISK
jgi:hypothetical protein